MILTHNTPVTDFFFSRSAHFAMPFSLLIDVLHAYVIVADLAYVIALF